MSYGRETTPIALAHRGGAHLAPENTLAAFRMSAALGVRYLETDVKTTRDGHLVCFHDDTLERVTDGSGRVSDHTLDQVQRLTVLGGEQIPTLAEALDALPGLNFAIDLKDHAAVAPMARLLAERPDDARRICSAGAWDGWLAELRQQCPHAHTSLGWRSLTTLITLSKAGVQVPRRLATGAWAHVPITLGRVPIFADRLVQRAHRIGVRVLVWTVNDPVLMERLLDAGVDGIITDRPDLLREIMIRREVWAPMGVPVVNEMTGETVTA